MIFNKHNVGVHFSDFLNSSFLNQLEAILSLIRISFVSKRFIVLIETKFENFIIVVRSRAIE